RPPGTVGALQSRRKPDDQQPRIGVTERGYRRIEPLGFAGPRSRREARKPRTELTIAIGFGAQAGGGGFGRAGSRPHLNRRNLHRPLAPWWSPAAGIVARGVAVRAAPDAPTGRGRAWVAAPRDQ